MLIKRADRYILSEVIGPFLGSLVFFCFVFLMFQLLRLAEFFIVHGVNAFVLLKMTFELILTILPNAVPISFLLGILIGVGRLSTDSELVAFKAGGVGLKRLTLPVLLFSLFVAFVTYELTGSWVPASERAFKETIIKIGSTRAVSSQIKEGTFTSGFFDLLIFADHTDSKNNRLKHVFIYDEREPKNPLIVVAKQGELLPVKPTLGGGTAAAMMLKLYDGNIHRSDVGTDAYQKINFGEYRLFLKVNEGAAGAASKPRMIDSSELWLRMHAKSESIGSRRELGFEYWRRVGMGLTPFLFVFMGMGLGSLRTRSVRSGAFLVTLSVVLFFWLGQGVLHDLVLKGFLPVYGVLLPNLFLLVFGVWSFRRSNW